MSCVFVTRLSEGEVGVVGEPHSQIALLKRVLRERAKEMEEFQHKLLDQSTSEVYSFVLLSIGVHYTLAHTNGMQFCICSL